MFAVFQFILGVVDHLEGRMTGSTRLHLLWSEKQQYRGCGDLPAHISLVLEVGGNNM